MAMGKSNRYSKQPANQFVSTCIRVLLRPVDGDARDDHPLALAPPVGRVELQLHGVETA